MRASMYACSLDFLCPTANTPAQMKIHLQTPQLVLPASGPKSCLSIALGQCISRPALSRPFRPTPAPPLPNELWGDDRSKQRAPLNSRTRPHVPGRQLTSKPGCFVPGPFLRRRVGGNGRRSKSKAPVQDLIEPSRSLASITAVLSRLPSFRTLFLSFLTFLLSSLLSLYFLSSLARKSIPPLASGHPRVSSTYTISPSSHANTFLTLLLQAHFARSPNHNINIPINPPFFHFTPHNLINQ